jgi:hypothetical protein
MKNKNKIVFIKVRYALVKLMYQCIEQTKICLNENQYNKAFEWVELKREFEKLITYYDDGNKLNEEYLIKIYDSDINIKYSKFLIIRRLIKLIKITK